MRTMVQQLRQTTDRSEAEARLAEVKSVLDRLAARGIIHKNKAANYKSELEHHVNQLES